MVEQLLFFGISPDITCSLFALNVHVICTKSQNMSCGFVLNNAQAVAKSTQQTMFRQQKSCLACWTDTAAWQLQDRMQWDPCLIRLKTIKL